MLHVVGRVVMFFCFIFYNQNNLYKQSVYIQSIKSVKIRVIGIFNFYDNNYQDCFQERNKYIETKCLEYTAFLQCVLSLLTLLYFTKYV